MPSILITSQSSHQVLAPLTSKSKMTPPKLQHQFSISSKFHFVNIRNKPTDHMNSDFALLRTMRNQLASRAAFITLKSPMAAQQALIVSIKMVGAFDCENQVIDAAERVVREWQRENDNRGKFPFDRRQIWQHYIHEKPGRYTAASRPLSHGSSILMRCRCPINTPSHRAKSTSLSCPSSNGPNPLDGDETERCTGKSETSAHHANPIADVVLDSQLGIWSCANYS